MTAPPAAALVPHPAVETAYLAPEAVLYDDRTGNVYRLNPSASAVWLLLDGSADEEAVARDIAEIFEVPLDQVRGDVGVALQDFRAQGLLVAAAGRARTPVEADSAADEVPRSVRRLLTHPPAADEVAVALRVFVRGGRALLAHVEDPDAVDPGALAAAGVVEVAQDLSFVGADGTTVSCGDLRWPLLGVLVAAAAPLDLAQARRRLWPLGRGDRTAWEALVGSPGWVVVAEGDVNDALVTTLAGGAAPGV